MLYWWILRGSAGRNDQDAMRISPQMCHRRHWACSIYQLKLCIQCSSTTKVTLINHRMGPATVHEIFIAKWRTKPRYTKHNLYTSIHCLSISTLVIQMRRWILFHPIVHLLQQSYYVIWMWKRTNAYFVQHPARVNVYKPAKAIIPLLVKCHCIFWCACSVNVHQVCIKGLS